MLWQVGLCGISVTLNEGAVCIVVKILGSRIMFVMNLLLLVMLLDVPEHKIECFWSINVQSYIDSSHSYIAFLI
jgi:hypothetical protein